MSNRDSLGFGELLPQDVVDIFAQEKHGKKGRKKRSHSLGRALGWLKGKKRKNLGAEGRNVGLGPALDLASDGHPAGHQGGNKGAQKSGRLAHPQGNSHAVPKRDDDEKTAAPPLFQENVFIESSRPKYLEDLHTEALEGLKMMQEEETNHGGGYQDTESTISTMSVQTDGEGGGFTTDSTIADSSSVVSVKSSASTRSSRSGLTRQGSTFRPLNSGKKPEKAKTRRRQRRTVAGIPHHVQREMGLDRADWQVTQNLDEELYNGESECSPTTDLPQQAADSPTGAGASVIQPLNKDQVEQHNAAHAGHRDDLALLQHLGPELADEQRPWSLAVPWMTTASGLQDPPSPVMSMSPQAAYMSKIIPNAVLPPSIDVVEISRGRSRNSVRTVSKSSLILSSPTSSRASSRASRRTTSSRGSTLTSTSRHNVPNLSDSSGWSNSESSETLVSDSSTISSSGTLRQKKDGNASAKEDKNRSINKASNGKLIIKEDEVNKDGQFVRSLSVIKSKRAPPPPSRSYSLHNKMKRRSRDLAEVRIISEEPSLHSISVPAEENEKHKPGSSPVPSRVIDSPGYNADTSSLDDSTGSASLSPIKSQLQAPKTEDAKTDAQTISKDTSQEKQEPPQENKLNKIISPSSGYSSQDGMSPQRSREPHGSSPKHKKGILAKLQRLFPGSTSAGSAPTQPAVPENSAERPKLDSVDTVSVSPSVQTLRELFNIPPPPKVHAPPPPPPEVWAHNKRTFELLLGPPAPDNTYAIVKKNPKDRRQQRQSPSVSTEGSVKSLVLERKHKNPAVTVESVNGFQHVLEEKKVQESGILNAEIRKENNERLAQNVGLKENGKDEKVRASDILNVMLVRAVESRKERLAAVKEEESKKTSTQATLPAISSARISPSPTPPPTHTPLQPLAKQTTEVTSVTLVQAVVSPESSWPPPPPPQEGQMVLSVPDEVDLPLPPPPMFSEGGPVLPVQVAPKTSILGGDSPCTSTSAISVVKTESVKVITVAEPQKPSTSQERHPPPLIIPPPPPYTAPPPPPTAILPPATIKVPPPPKEVSPPEPREVSPPPPPPPPPVNVIPVRPKESSPPVIKVVLPPVEDNSPTAVTVVSSSPPKEVSPPRVVNISPLPPKEVSALPPEEIPPPPPPVNVLPVRPKESSPPVIKVVLPPVKDNSPAPVTVVSSSPPKEVSPPRVIDISPPEEVSALPPEEIPPPPPQPVNVLPVRPKQSSPPVIKVVLPPVKDNSPAPVTVVSSSPLKEVSPPQVISVSPLPPKEVSALPPEEIPPPPPGEVVSVRPKESSAPTVQEVLPLVKDNSPILATVVPPSPVQEVSLPLAIDISPLPPKEVSALSAEEVTIPPPQEDATNASEEATPVMLTPPESIPPPPPELSKPESSKQEIDVPQENIASEPETKPVSSNTILTPPQSIPPPPPVELLAQPQVVPPNTDGPATQETPPLPPSEVSLPPAPEASPSPEKAQEPVPSPPVHIPLLPPLPVEGLEVSPSPEKTQEPALSLPMSVSLPPPLAVEGLAVKTQPSPLSTENQSPTQPSSPAVQEEPTPIVTNTLLQMVKLRSISSSPEPPQTQEQPQAEVIMRKQEPGNQDQTSSASGEVPQKPIRRSLIVTSPTSTSPPATATSPPTLPKSQSVVVPPVTSPPVITSMKKSPTATASPSMNLQEAIRLRTAARSKESPGSRLSLHSPTSPIDLHRSPTSTASFIFSKSNKRVVMETKPVSEAKENVQKNLEDSSVTKVTSDAESLKKGAKVPPPVAKKPKSKGKEVETIESIEKTAGLEVQQEPIKDAAEKTNGTAGTVGGGTSST